MTFGSRTALRMPFPGEREEVSPWAFGYSARNIARHIRWLRLSQSRAGGEGLSRGRRASREQRRGGAAERMMILTQTGTVQEIALPTGSRERAT